MGLCLGREDPWKRAWQPTPVFLPGESNGQRSLVGYSPKGCKESDTIEVTEPHTHTYILSRTTYVYFCVCVCVCVYTQIICLFQD